MELRHFTGSLVTFALVTAAVAGCGGSNTTSAATQPAASSAAPAASGGSVAISNFKFKPASASVSRGMKVVVTNRDTTAHTVTADSGSAFDTGSINPGRSATVTLSKSGTYKYHCSIHPFMHGTFVVK